MESDPGFQAALEEAKSSFKEGGVPIGACLVGADGTILGTGHNMRVQKGSATLHVWNPCDMCTGACVMYKVARVVIGENKTFIGGEAYLKQRGIKVDVLENEECKKLMQQFIEQNLDVW
ncbi:MAG: cytosine deaminase [Ramalina farinacea]|uniref:Cytosine deaminase n=1 Tax=Ramalina farinacea TaxID=258253 RepID=A0AA43TVN4_9LECA|nr:cytosine deaminase [Ramalina farinacea]